MNHLKTLNLNLANNTFGLEYGEYYNLLDGDWNLKNSII